jgi:hypothetical protein
VMQTRGRRVMLKNPFCNYMDYFAFVLTD